MVPNHVKPGGPLHLTETPFDLGLAFCFVK